MVTKVNLENGAIEAFTASIADSGTTTSAGIDLGSKTLCGVHIPSGFDGSTLTFTASTTLDGTYLAVEYTPDGTIGASKYIPIDPSKVAGIRYIKPVVGTQTGAIDLTLVARGM
jgi:hypothetical protein